MMEEGSEEMGIATHLGSTGKNIGSDLLLRKLSLSQHQGGWRVAFTLGQCLCWSF